MKNKMTTVAGQMFVGYEKELDNSNHLVKRYDDYNGDNKSINDISDKIRGDNVKKFVLRKINFIKIVRSTDLSKF